MAKRKRYGIEFQASAVKMILHKGHSIADVSRILGVDYSVLWRWKKKYQKLLGHDSPSQKPNTSQVQEITILNAKLKQVIEERNTLMKTLSHFISQQD